MERKTYRKVLKYKTIVFEDKVTQWVNENIDPSQVVSICNSNEMRGAYTIFYWEQEFLDIKNPDMIL